MIEKYFCASRNRLVHIATSNLELLASACRTLVDNPQYNDFWVLSGLTDRSYEEGDRNSAFNLEVERYESAGLAQLTSAKLRAGINGNLAATLAAVDPDISVTRNKWAGQDLAFALPGRAQAAAEIKLVFDCTMPKYYDSLADDLVKLNKRRADGYIGDLFAVIFFVSLPKYNYPSGQWYNIQWKSRSTYIRSCGISNQFTQAEKFLQHKPAWPASGSAHVKKLNSPNETNLKVVTELFSENFEADEAWRFNAMEHLRDAEVGVGIWEI